MAAMLVLLLQACELIDASKVENPQITDDNLRTNAVGGATPVVTGLRRQMAVAIGQQALIGDLVSDNLDNRTSFYDVTLSNPRTIVPTTFTYDAAYNAMLQMNAIADFGLSVIVPMDTKATSDQIAEIRFYKGMALLLLGENYRMFPVVENAAAITATQALQLAVTEFNTALPLISAASNATNNSMRANCQLGLARTYRMLGNKVSAAAAITAFFAIPVATTFDPTTYVFTAQFDAANGPTSNLRSALVSRSGNDIQPNPRLDFLDPKIILGTTPTPVLKSEEAYLIQAEIELSNGNLANARTQMTSAVTRALARGRTAFTDADIRFTRPNNNTVTAAIIATMTVFSDSGRTYPAVAGLLAARSGASVQVPTISWTSQTATTIANLAAVAVGSGTVPNTLRFEHIRTLYLLRQEIFFGEGRRMTDLGMRMPVTQRQIDGNPSVAGTVATQVLVPAWIPPTDEYRFFSIVGTVVTMRWDMNKELALNINSVSPFAPIP